MKSKAALMELKMVCYYLKWRNIDFLVLLCLNDTKRVGAFSDINMMCSVGSGKPAVRHPFIKKNESMYHIAAQEHSRNSSVLVGL